MKLSRPSLMQLVKSMLSAVVAEAVVSVVDSGGEVVVTGAAVALPEVAVKISQVSLTPNRDQDSTRVLNIQTCPRVTGPGARCISAGGAKRTSAPSRRHVRGGTCSRLRTINEVLTSSARKVFLSTQLKNCCIQTNSREYIMMSMKTNLSLKKLLFKLNGVKKC